VLLLVQAEKGAAELNYMWLPTWIGMNTRLKQDMEKELTSQIVGKTAEEANDIVLDYLCSKFPIEGLRDYLDGLKFIQER
jgi:hypothetical protein